jgi:hypothetical protein
MRRYRSLAFALCAAAIAACDKNGVQNITAPSSGAQIKFFNFGVTTPGVTFYANDQKLTAISSAICQPPADTTSLCRTTGNDSTVGTAYGAAGSGGLYNQLTPGQYTLTGRIAAVSANHPTIATVSTSLEDGKHYSYFVSGIYDPVARKADAFVVEDVLPASDNKIYVRFVNAISNSSSMALFATPSSGTEVQISAAVPYKGAGTFVAIGSGAIGTGGVLDLTVRASAGSPVLISRAAVSFLAGRVYTVTARGDMTSTVTANKPALDNTANR